MTPGKITDDKSMIINLPKEKPTKWSTEMTKFDKDKDYFHIMTHSEAHNVRRKKILEAHPEVEKLFEKDRSSLYYTIALNIFQLLMITFIKYYVDSWFYLILLTYFIGATANHALFVLMHDITHFTCFKSVFTNQLLGILTNIPQALPNAVSFGRYHRDHHTYMGHEIDDPDIPVLMEIQTFRNPLTKTLFLILMPIFYALRPYYKKPKIQNKMELLNIVVIFTMNYLIIQYFGGKAFFYLFVGTLWGLSINPVGAHVIAEHYEFNKNQETYSYYGVLNYINFNIGYHIEHHDFPNISWRKLPELRKLAPEFYDTLPQVDSYFTIMFKYIFDCDIGPWSRVVRYEEEKNSNEDKKQQ
jgi:sphingolipid 4-desaturase/C4-monooxygenase